MADKRLQDIRTSDDAESTINVELIEWLKTSGVNYLLFILVIVVAFRGWLWWGERQDRIRDEAWADLAGTDSAASLEALADRAAGIDSVSELALLRAADLYQLDILRDQTLDLLPDTPSIGDPDADSEDAGADADKPTPPMTPEEREQTLDRMQRIYERVLESTGPSGNGINWKETLHIQAMFGLAAVAEMRGDFEGAAQWFSQIESVAGARYEELAKVAAAWRTDQSAARTRIEFPLQDVVSAALDDIPVEARPAGDVNADGLNSATDTGTETEVQPEAEPAEPSGEEPPAEEPPSSGDGG